MSEGPIITGTLQLKDETGKTLSSIQKKMGSAFDAIAKGAMIAGAAAVTGIGLSIKSAADFEQALSRIIAASGKTGEAANTLEDALSDAAMTLGPQFGISAIDAVVALEALVKAGLEGEDAITALTGSLQLAALEGLNTAETSNMMVQAMTMFGVEAKDAGKIIDSFSAASDAGIGTAGDYAKGLSNVGATAASMGMSLDETMAALVQLDNTFGSAQSGGTFLNRMLLDMVAKADEAGLMLYEVEGATKAESEALSIATDAMESLGDEHEAAAKKLRKMELAMRGAEKLSWESKDALKAQKAEVKALEKSYKASAKMVGKMTTELSTSHGEMRNLDDIIRQVRTKLQGFGDDQAAANKWLGLFDTRAQKAILGLSGYDETLTETETKLGGMQSAQDKVNTVLDTFSGRVQKAKTRIQAMSISLGEQLIPYAENVLGAFEDFIPVLSTLITDFGKFTSKIFDVARALSKGEWEAAYDIIEETYSDISSKFVEWFDEIDWDDVWANAREFLGKIYDKFMSWAGNIGTAFFNWFGTVNWNTVFSKLNAWMNGFYNWLFASTSDIGAAFKNWVGTVNWSSVFQSLGAFAVNLPLWIVAQLLKAPATLAALIGKYITETDWDEVFSAIGDGVVDTLKGAADALLNWMPNWLKKLLGLKKIPTPDKPKAEEPTPPPPMPTPPPTYTPLPPPGSSDLPDGPWGPDQPRFASGFEGMVTSPTTFLAGEAGPEYVSITPRGKPAAGMVNQFAFHVNGNMDERACIQVMEYINKRLRKY